MAWVALAAGGALGVAARAIAFTQHGHDAFDAEVDYSTFCRFDALLPGVAIAILESFHPALFATLRRHGHPLLFRGILSSVAVLYCIINELPGPFFATAFGYSLLAIAFSLLTLEKNRRPRRFSRQSKCGCRFSAAWSGLASRLVFFQRESCRFERSRQQQQPLHCCLCDASSRIGRFPPASPAGLGRTADAQEVGRRGLGSAVARMTAVRARELTPSTHT